MLEGEGGDRRDSRAVAERSQGTQSGWGAVTGGWKCGWGGCRGMGMPLGESQGRRVGGEGGTPLPLKRFPGVGSVGGSQIFATTAMAIHKAA